MFININLIAAINSVSVRKSDRLHDRSRHASNLNWKSNERFKDTSEDSIFNLFHFHWKIWKCSGMVKNVSTFYAFVLCK